MHLLVEKIYKQQQNAEKYKLIVFSITFLDDS